jgi:adenylyltransferase/sulfurtransferase
MEKKPLVTAPLGQFDASLATIRVHESGPDGRPNPTYRGLFPSPPLSGAIPTCAEAGVLSALAGIVDRLMTMEIIREIVGFGEGLVERLLMVNARSMRFDTVRYLLDETNPLSGRQRRALPVQYQVSGKVGHR